MLIVHEEVGLVAADIRSEVIIVVANLRRFDTGNRIWPGIECGVFVAVVKSKADSINLLAKKTAPAPAAKRAPTARAASGTAARAPSSSAKDCSATTAGSTESLSASTAAGT